MIGLLQTALLPDSRPLKLLPSGVVRLTFQVPLGVLSAAAPAWLSNKPPEVNDTARVLATLAALDETALPSLMLLAALRLTRLAPPVSAALTSMRPPLMSASVPVPAVGVKAPATVMLPALAEPISSRPEGVKPASSAAARPSWVALSKSPIAIARPAVLVCNASVPAVEPRAMVVRAMTSARSVMLPLVLVKVVGSRASNSAVLPGVWACTRMAPVVELSVVVPWPRMPRLLVPAPPVPFSVSVPVVVRRVGVASVGIAMPTLIVDPAAPLPVPVMATVPLPVASTSELSWIHTPTFCDPVLAPPWPFTRIAPAAVRSVPPARNTPSLLLPVLPPMPLTTMLPPLASMRPNTSTPWKLPAVGVAPRLPFSTTASNPVVALVFRITAPEGTRMLRPALSVSVVA